MWYLKTNDDNQIDVHVDFAIIHKKEPVLISLVDIAIKNKKIVSNLIKYENFWQNSEIELKNREIDHIAIPLERIKLNFKHEKFDNKYSHTMILNRDRDKFIIDWNNDGIVKCFTSHLRNKLYMPVTEEIVKKLLDNYFSWYGESIDCDVYSNNKEINGLCAWWINEEFFTSNIKGVDVEAEENNNINWNNINTINDYLIEFADEIKEKLKNNINIMYDENNVSPYIFEGKKKPFKGQIELIQGGVEVLKRKHNNHLYLSAEQGSGKTLMSIKINHAYNKEMKRENYVTLVVAPAITLNEWADEVANSIDNVNVIIIKKAIEFIKLYNKTNLKFDKPTYIIVGKETFKLSYQKRHGIIPKRRTVTRTIKNEESRWDFDKFKDVTEPIELCVCPDCGSYQKNMLKKSTDEYFQLKDYNKIKKSNYKCCECGSVLFQATYNKSKKVSVIEFIKRKNIKFKTIIIDEAQESSNYNSIIGQATRQLIKQSDKTILLSGTVTNGYASSIYNLLFALIPNQLQRDGVFDQETFIKEYGTLEAISNVEDSDYYASSRTKVKEMNYKEVEGINPVVYQRYFAETFIFAELRDLKSDLPNMKEYFIEVENNNDVYSKEEKLSHDIQSENPLNFAFYENSIVKHYTNNPFDWNKIPVHNTDGIEIPVQPYNFKDNIILNKEKKLIEICKKEYDNGRKSWVYVDFSHGGQYMKGKTLPDRLKELLEKEGLRVFVLKQSVKNTERRNIIMKNKDSYDVFISNPKLISVGVNLQFCPNYIFYSPSYMVNTVRQASMRGMRINSTQDNHIYHLYYSKGVEYKVMERFKLKMAEGMAIESKFKDIEVRRTASGLSKQINDVII